MTELNAVTVSTFSLVEPLDAVVVDIRLVEEFPEKLPEMNGMFALLTRFLACHYSPSLCHHVGVTACMTKIIFIQYFKRVNHQIGENKLVPVPNCNNDVRT